MRRTRHLARGAWAVCALLCAGPVLGQSPAPSDNGAFSEVTDVLAVEIPVQVVRDGAPVRGLTAADFEVLEGRTRRPVTAFEAVDPGAPAEASAAAARRRVLLLFDLAFAAPQSVVIARQAARQLLAGGLAPGDLVAVASYSDAEGVRLLLNFTSDRRQAEEAVASLGVQEVRPADPLLLLSPTPAGQTAGGGEGGDLQLVNRLQLLAQRYSSANLEDQKMRVGAQLRALHGLGQSLANISGRKQLLFFSEGFDSSLVVGTQDIAEMVQLNARVERGGVTDFENNERRFGNTSLAGDVERMAAELRRGDVVLHAVDVGGVRRQGNQPGYRAEGEDSLFVLARPTGGELVQNFADLGVALRPVFERSGVGYVLTIQPEAGPAPKAGTYGFRRLEVKVKGAGRGTRVLHRAGYGPPGAPPAAPGAPAGLGRALAAGSLVLAGREGGSLPAAVLAAAFPGPAGGSAPAYVPVLIEVDGPRLLAGPAAAAAASVHPVEIYAYAVDGEGRIGGHFSQTLALDPAAAGPALAGGGLKYFGHLDLPPGAYSLRVLVRNGRSGAHALRVVPLAVPDFAAAGPVLLPPLFPEPAGRWLLTREKEPGPASFPFVLRDQPFMPAARPRIAADQDAAVALVAWGLGRGELQAAARVLGLDGREVMPAGLSLLDQESGGAAGLDRFKAVLHPPAGLAPGEYLLEVSLADPAGGAAGRSSVRVVVVAPAPGAG